jgi:hypothetical protein
MQQYITPAPSITAGSNEPSLLVLGGVGFNSMGMGRAITAGFRPSGVAPSQKK